MKLRNPRLIRLAALVGTAVIRLLIGTVRYRIDFRGQPVDPNDPATKGRFIYAFWHDSMLFPAGRRPKARIQVLISQHADGELITQIARRLGFEAVRGSSTRGGVEAVRRMLRLSTGSHLVVTPDGPRGPRRRVQPGIVYLASRTGLPIVPAGIGYEKAWRAKSWDRFAVPKPFSTGTCIVADPIDVPADIDRTQLEHYRLLVEEELLAVTSAAEEWAKSGIRRQKPRTLIRDSRAGKQTTVQGGQARQAG